MDFNVIQMVLLDDLTQQLRRLNETGLPAAPLVSMVPQPAAALPAVVPPPITALPAVVPPPITALPFGTEATRRFVLTNLLNVSTAIQTLGEDFKNFSKEFEDYAKERRARGRLVADTETIDDTGRTIEIEGGMMYFCAINKGTRYGMYCMLNDQYPGEWRAPGEQFVASFPTRAINRVRLLCRIDESTTVEYFGLF